MTRGRLCALAVAGLALVWPAGAEAGRVQQTIFDAGPGLLNADSNQRANRLDQLQRLGADTVRLVLPWRSFAPSPGRRNKPDGFSPMASVDYRSCPSPASTRS